MAFVEIGDVNHEFLNGVFRMHLGGAPRFIFDGSASQKIASDFGVELARRSFGKVKLSPLCFPFRLAGWSMGNQLGNNRYEFSITGEIVDERLANFLAATADDPGRTLVYQILPEETPDVLLQRIVGDEMEVRPTVGEALVVPSAFGCLLRPGAMSTRAFFDMVVGVVGAECPALVGWRILPSYEGGGIPAVSFVLSEREDNAPKLAKEAWLPCAPEHSGKNGSALILRHVKSSPYAALEDVLRELLSSGTPRHNLFGTSDPVPGAPCWIQYDMTEWFAEEIVVKIYTGKDAGNEQRAQIEEIELVLQQVPSLPIPAALSARVARAQVKDWSENGDALLVTPEDGANWSIAGGDSLAVDCLTPAHFGAERGGIYCRPHQDDPRHVLLVQGQPPVSAGASMIKIDGIEDEEVDIRFKCAALELVGDGTHLSARKGELKVNAENVIEFHGTTQVQGTLDVS